MKTLPPPQMIPSASLVFDKRNARIQEAARDIGGTLSQDDILGVLWREFAVDEIALSMVANGFFSNEPLIAAKEKGELIVVEGNRRLAAIRLLLSAEKRANVGATDLPRISGDNKKSIELVPVITSKRSDVWDYVGFKHVNGPQAWQSLAKAEYIAWVHNSLAVDLGDIARHIGDQHSTVVRLYRALMAIEQAERAKVFQRADRWKKHFSFSHLYTGLDYTNIQGFTGIGGEKSYRRDPIPKSRLIQFGEFCVWLYGSKSRGREPLVQSQNPHLRQLDEILGSENGIAALRRNLSLQVSLDISKGDEALFREAMVAAKQALTQARGRLLTGYDGQRDLLDSAEDIRDLATSIYQEMLDRGTRRRGTRSSVKSAAKR